MKPWRDMAKLPGNPACDSSNDAEIERLCLMQYGHGERVTIIDRRRNVSLPVLPTTLWGRIVWALLPWNRPKLTPEQREALKLLD